MSATRLLYFGSRTWLDVQQGMTLAVAQQRQRQGILFRGPLSRIMQAQLDADVAAHPGGIVLIEGEAVGADIMARLLADGPGFRVDPYPADWKRHGRRAVWIRNEAMAREGKPLAARGFISGACGTALSRGSASMVEILGRYRIPLILHREDGVQMPLDTARRKP